MSHSEKIEKIEASLYTSVGFSASLCNCEFTALFCYFHCPLLLTGYHLDIAIVTETHLKKHHLPGLYRADGFQIFRRDRLARIHGRVAIIVRSDFDAEEHLMDNVDRSIELL